MTRIATAPATPAVSPAEAGARPLEAPVAVAATVLARVNAEPPPAASADDVRRATEQANERLRQTGSELTFEFNDEVGRVVVRLVDTSTREVLRQFPSEEMLQIARALKQEKLAGALLRAAA
ncbi:MAG: flagellar protein FlaG [Burkholderiaceae bacterium]|jgi:flagellar protein FlaG|nr:flagellar protein FlaG [Burkholderiaceae bacterium]